MADWANPSPQPKQHLDRFSRFCRAHYCDRLTDRQTDRPRYTRSVTIGGIYVRSTAMRPNNDDDDDDDDTSFIKFYGAVTVTRPLRQLRCSPGSVDERRFSARWPPTLRPSGLLTWTVSPPVGCCRPHSSSPFIIITQSVR